MMPTNSARRLALDTTVSTENLEAMLDRLKMKLDAHEVLQEPTPLHTYRQSRIIGLALKMREH
jgi:hypothetical protein